MSISGELTDSELLELMKSNNKEAFSLLYNRYWEDLLTYSFRIVNDREICMDILQDVFVWFWNKREFLSIESVRAYLFTAVRYQIANHIRKAKVRDTYVARQNLTANSEVCEDSLIEVKELLRLIQHFSALLPERRREVFELSRFNYLTNKEIAQKLNISEKTVEMHITLAVKFLKVSLDKVFIFFVFFL